ncbi:MAG: 30S ribosome-binding factor RbfA [Syntrophales bacterium]|nr:30S ribosome-binding factor RbfA [Syntrophales bacterium]
MGTFRRAERVADRICEELSEILQREVGDPRVAMVTITGAKVSSDLRHARVFYVELGQDVCRPETQEAMRRATGFLRRQLGKRLQLRYVPELIFEVDKSFICGSRIEYLIREIHKSGHDSEDS